MYDIDEYRSSAKEFDKYELAKVFQHVKLHKSDIHHLDDQMIKQLEQYFCYFVNPKAELYDRDKCTFGYEVVGEDDQNRLFISGEYSTILKQAPSLPGHNYYFSFAMKKCGDNWILDAGHLLEMSFLRSLYVENLGTSGKYRAVVESEHGKKELEVSDISKHNWLQEFNALSAA
jgi:hypothetical protein